MKGADMADQDATLDRVRKLLAKAEAEGVTPPEAEALTAKAAELMARYGIDKALLAATRPDTDQLVNHKITIENPWANVRVHLLNGIFSAMRCKVIKLNDGDNAVRVHVFGYKSDMDRAEMLYTSLLVQMHRALAAQRVPAAGGRAKAWRRSWMLGFVTAVTDRIDAAEKRAATQADASRQASGPSTALVLRDRSLAVQSAFRAEYPVTSSRSVSCRVGGYSDGRAAGQRADIGGARVGAGYGRALAR